MPQNSQRMVGLRLLANARSARDSLLSVRAHEGRGVGGWAAQDRISGGLLPGDVAPKRAQGGLLERKGPRAVSLRSRVRDKPVRAGVRLETDDASRCPAGRRYPSVTLPSLSGKAGLSEASCRSPGCKNPGRPGRAR
jgi:hypothetical protein